MAPAIERRRRMSVAFEPSDTEPARPGTPGVVTGSPLVLLRSEGVALLAMATVMYGRYGRSWWLFMALLPAPDVRQTRRDGMAPAWGVTDDPWARHSYAVTAAGRVPGAKLVSMDRGGHLFLSHDAQVRAAIRGFIQSVAQPERQPT